MIDQDEDFNWLIELSGILRNLAIQSILLESGSIIMEGTVKAAYHEILGRLRRKINWEPVYGFNPGDAVQLSDSFFESIREDCYNRFKSMTSPTFEDTRSRRYFFVELKPDVKYGKPPRSFSHSGHLSGYSKVWDFDTESFGLCVNCGLYKDHGGQYFDLREDYVCIDVLWSNSSSGTDLIKSKLLFGTELLKQDNTGLIKL